jgi:hypothetical protein
MNLQLIFSKCLNRIFLFLLISFSILFGQPRSGDIYREYSRTMGQTNHNWRVTDPNVRDERAFKHLPNAVLHIDIGDLKDAVRAEALIDRWGGHPGTSNKKIRFNENPWIQIPELKTTPAGQEPDRFVYQDNPIINIPLNHLKEGDNTFEGTCDDPDKKWPQWGWDGIVIRIYYKSGKSHPVGNIVEPKNGGTFGENPQIKVETESEAGIERIDFLGYYDGYDENGDGIYKEWHRQYWCVRGDSIIDIRYHIGTANKKPFQVTWDTRWIPDQEAGAIKMLARIKDKNGLWYVTQPVVDLSLRRPNVSVKIYKSYDVPESFTTRIGQTKSCKIDIPDSDNLKQATEVLFHLRTWNGTVQLHEPFKINDWAHQLEGISHNFDYDIIPVPLSAVKNGENSIIFFSKTEAHGVEVLWPGPALTIRYQKK